MAVSATNLRSPSIRLVVADIDGTLVTKEKLLTQRSVQAVHKLHEAGIIFGVTTGRPPKGARMLIEGLAHLRFIAGFNGGVIVNRDMQIFSEHLLGNDTAEEVLNIILENHLDAWLYTDKDWFIRDRMAYRVDREEKTVKFPAKVTRTFDGLFNRVAKVVGVSEDFDAVAHCEKIVQGRFRDSVSAARSQKYYLDVTDPKANKGEVVRSASNYFNVPLQQVASIGDMANDITMFKVSGISIAMGNASPEVQQAATFVTATNQEEGFAIAVDEFILPQQDASAA